MLKVREKFQILSQLKFEIDEDYYLNKGLILGYKFG